MTTQPALEARVINHAPANIIWLTPAELAERRALVLPPVKVRELAPFKREITTSDDNAQVKNLLQQAPTLVQRAKDRGWIRTVHQPAGTHMPNKGVWSRASRQKLSASALRRYRDTDHVNTTTKS